MHMNKLEQIDMRRSVRNYENPIFQVLEISERQ